MADPEGVVWGGGTVEMFRNSNLSQPSKSESFRRAQDMANQYFV